MKEIKFRRPFFKEAYPYEFSHFGIWGVKLGQTEFTSPSYNNNCSHKEDQQYTGLLDKQGKEIYEGDIVKHDMFYSGDYREDANTGYIEWDEEGHHVSRIDNNGEIMYVCSTWDLSKNYGGEVIGNIYEPIK